MRAPEVEYELPQHYPASPDIRAAIA